MTAKPPSTAAAPFTGADRAAVYRAIQTRRGVRSRFTDRPIDDATLLRLLAMGGAGDCAPVDQRPAVLRLGSRGWRPRA